MTTQYEKSTDPISFRPTREDAIRIALIRQKYAIVGPTQVIRTALKIAAKGAAT